MIGKRENGMLREKCRTCGSGDLYQGRMGGQGMAVMSAKSFFRFANIAKCAVCVTCGGIEPYMDDAAINKVKGWKATESHQFPMTPSEGDDARVQVNLRIALVLVATLAAIAAFVMTQVASFGDKLK
jgi:hypothetical protein